MLSKVKEQSSERVESSTLFSLQELRRLEDDRVAKEAQAARGRVEAERRAKEEAERRVQEAAAERVRAEEERARRLEEERLARIREDQLRLEEAERRARIDGEMKLKQERLRLEMEQQRHEPRRGWRSPLVTAGAVAVVLLGVGGVIVVRMNDHHQTKSRILQQQIEEQHQQALAAQAEYEREIKALRDETQRRLNETKDLKARARILEEEKRQAQLLRDMRDKAPGGHRPTRLPGADVKSDGKTDRHRFEKRTVDATNPLEGLTGGGL